MKRLTTAQQYYRRHHGVHKTYTGLDKNDKTMTVRAYTQAEARAEMRKAGFSPVKIFRM